MVNLAQSVMLISEYTVGPDGDISTEQLANMSELTADTITTYDPGFTPNQRLLFQTYLILNLWESREGGGGVSSEKVLDTAWTSNIETSSIWMDNARRMVVDFRAIKKYNVVPMGVRRCDTHMDRLRFDNTELWRRNF